MDSKNPVIICEGHISSRCAECKGCLSDLVKEELVSSNSIQDDGIRNAQCPYYLPIKLHLYIIEPRRIKSGLERFKARYGENWNSNFVVIT